MSFVVSGLNLTPAAGSLVYGAGSPSNWSTLPLGSAGQALVSTGTTLTYQNIPGGNTTIINESANTNLDPANTGQVYVWSGATNSAAWTLPATSPGLNYTIVIASPGGTNTNISLGIGVADVLSEVINTNSAGTTRTNTTISYNASLNNQFAVIKLLCIATGVWVVTDVIGPWNF